MEEVSVWNAWRRSSWRIRAQFASIWLTGAAVVISAAWVVLKLVIVLVDPSLEAKKPPAPPPVVAAPFTYVVELKDLSFPMISRVKNRVMHGRFTVQLDCPTDMVRQRLEASKPKLLDAILELTSEFYLEDFMTVQGFDDFKKKLTESLGHRFHGGAPREVAIQDWTIG
jgi:flagellar basal body-associated protein FliL